MESSFGQTHNERVTIGLGAGLLKRFQKEITISVAAEDVLTLVTPVHEMINSAFILPSQFSNRPRQTKEPHFWSRENRIIPGTDLFTACLS